MAERKFDYAQMSDIYKNMQQIIGDSGNVDSIAGILYDIDKNVHQDVDVCNMALYGDLGKQMLLNWDNTSSNFNGFIEKFSDWCTLVASASGNYAEFEQKVAGFKEANPFGVAGVGLTANYIDSSDYNGLTSELIDEYAAYLTPLYAMTGATYIDTGAVAAEEDRKVWAWVDWGVSGVGLVLDIVGMGFIAKGATTALKAGTGALSTVVRSNLDDAARVVVNSSDELAEGSVKMLTSGADNFVDDGLRAAANSVDNTTTAFVTTDPVTGEIITSFDAPAMEVLDSAGNVIATYGSEAIEISTQAVVKGGVISKVTSVIKGAASGAKNTVANVANTLRNKASGLVTKAGLKETAEGVVKETTEKVVKEAVEEGTEKVVKETVEEVVESSAANSGKSGFISKIKDKISSGLSTAKDKLNAGKEVINQKFLGGAGGFNETLNNMPKGNYEDNIKVIVQAAKDNGVDSKFMSNYLGLHSNRLYRDFGQGAVSKEVFLEALKAALGTIY